MAQDIKTLLGPGFFIRRDRQGRALFISDYPARADRNEIELITLRVRQAGFLVQMMDGLALLDWDMIGYAAFFEGLKGQVDGQACGLAHLYGAHPQGFTEAMLKDARAALLLLDAGKTELLKRRAGEALAVALRQKTAVPLYYPLLLMAAKMDQKENEPC